MREEREFQGKREMASQAAASFNGNLKATFSSSFCNFMLSNHSFSFLFLFTTKILYSVTVNYKRFNLRTPFQTIFFFTALKPCQLFVILIASSGILLQCRGFDFLSLFAHLF